MSKKPSREQQVSIYVRDLVRRSFTHPHFDASTNTLTAVFAPTRAPVTLPLKTVPAIQTALVAHVGSLDRFVIEGAHPQAKPADLRKALLDFANDVQTGAAFESVDDPPAPRPDPYVTADCEEALAVAVLQHADLAVAVYEAGVLDGFRSRDLRLLIREVLAMHATGARTNAPLLLATFEDLRVRERLKKKFDGPADGREDAERHVRRVIEKLQRLQRQSLTQPEAPIRPTAQAPTKRLLLDDLH